MFVPTSCIYTFQGKMWNCSEKHFSLIFWDKYMKRLLTLLHLGVKGRQWRFASFKVTSSNDRNLCVYDSSGHNSREHLVKGYLFEGLKKYMKNKKQGNENKVIPGEFKIKLIKRIKWARIVSIMRCQNSPWIIGLRIYREGKTQIPLSSPTTKYLLAQDPE